MNQLTRFILLPALVGAVIGLGIMLVDQFDATQKPGYAQAVATASPAVVNIYSTKITRRHNLSCDTPARKLLCDRLATPAPQVQNSLGSGVIVRANGYILTNQHVVAEADEILVMFANSQTTKAELIGSDSHTDLAVIKVPAENLPVIPQLNGEPVRVGDVALAIGNPFGFGHSVSQGIISAFSRTLITNSPYDDFIQTDAAISPGSSGGALVDFKGRLLGINTLIYSQSGGADGIGFAIPAALAIDVLNQIIDHGRVIRGWLGVSLVPQFLSGEGNGLRVTGIASGGPAQRAGILVDDVILSVNQVAANNPYSITDIIAKTPPGQTLQVEVLRDEQRFRATAIADELPAR